MASEIKRSGTAIRARLNSSKQIRTVEKETKPLQGFIRKFSNDWATTFAGALAYSLITALLPILIALVAIAGFILTGILHNPNGSNTIFSALEKIPALKSVSGSLQSSVGNKLSASAGPLAILAVIVAIIGGSRLFVAMEGSLNIIYRVRPRTALLQNAVAILMVVIFSLLTPIMILASTLPTTLLGLINSNASLKQIPFLQTVASNQTMILLGGYIGALFAAFVLFLAIYMIVPNKRIAFSKSWPGAIVAAILVELFIALFPFYIRMFMQSYVGQIGLAIALVVFFYYFAVILLLGAEVNAYFREHVQPLPNNLATFVSTVAGNLNEDRPADESEHHIDSTPTESKDRAHIARAHEDEEGNR
ncbi:YihY/virulence factor BrkB family protein [Ktedonobacteria bacterium brp13]|nr:YihY/virulence factor BrkB family protein [Ktedonobacteria bacterium brp13]